MSAIYLKYFSFNIDNSPAEFSMVSTGRVVVVGSGVGWGGSILVNDLPSNVMYRNGSNAIFVGNACEKRTLYLNVIV